MKTRKKKKRGGPTGWCNYVAGGSIPPVPTMCFLLSLTDRETVNDKISREETKRKQKRRKEKRRKENKREEKRREEMRKEE
jgi:hypothetical protein